MKIISHYIKFDIKSKFEKYVKVLYSKFSKSTESIVENGVWKMEERLEVSSVVSAGSGASRTPPEYQSDSSPNGAPTMCPKKISCSSHKRRQRHDVLSSISLFCPREKPLWKTRPALMTLVEKCARHYRCKCCFSLLLCKVILKMYHIIFSECMRGFNIFQCCLTLVEYFMSLSMRNKFMYYHPVHYDHDIYVDMTSLFVIIQKNVNLL